MKQRIEAIFFDLGETLLDFGKVDVQSLFEAGATLAYDYLKKLGQPLPNFARYHRRQLRAIKWNYLISHFTGREFNAMDVLARLGDRMGHNLTHEQTAEAAWMYYQPLAEQATMEDGIPAMLERFRNAGLTLGLISNTFLPPEVLDRHLEQFDLLKYFPIRVYSSAHRFRKPSRKIFKVAMKEAGKPAGNILFVGDSPKADIRGANRMGFVSVLKDPAGKYDGSSTKADHIIRKLTELEAVVAEYNGTAEQR